MNFCGCVNANEREIRGKEKDIKKRYAAKKPGKRRKETKEHRNRVLSQERDLSCDITGRAFNDQHSNVSVLLPNSNNQSVISDNNVTRGTMLSQNDPSSNRQSIISNMSTFNPSRRY